MHNINNNNTTLHNQENASLGLIISLTGAPLPKQQQRIGKNIKIAKPNAD